MNEHEEALMAKHGITAETKVVFRYAGYRYDRLADAVNYATAQAASTAGQVSQHEPGDRVD